MRCIVLFLMVVTSFSSYGQDELTTKIPLESAEIIRTKEEIGRKIFKKISKTSRWKFNYDDFVNPGEEFNTTDIESLPNRRLILGIRSKENLVILYEHGSYYGPVTQCLVAVSNESKFDLYILAVDVKTSDELFSLLQEGELRLKRI